MKRGNSYVKVLDVTLRDGGYLNNWTFASDTIHNIVSGLGNSGIEYVEVGYLSDDRSKPPSATCSASYLSRLQDYEAKIAAMLRIGERNTEAILKSRVGLVDLVRLPFNLEDIDKAVSIAQVGMSLGFNISFNLTSISAYTASDILKCIKKLNIFKEEAILYVADSRGALKPNETFRLFEMISPLWVGQLGFHGHNNLGLAAANTHAAAEAGCDLIDGSINGYGLGGGNTNVIYAAQIAENFGHGTEYDYDELLTISQIINLPQNIPLAYLYYLSGLKNMEQEWIASILEIHGNRSHQFINSLERKRYSKIEQILIS